MLLANVCAGSSVAATKLVENGVLGEDAGCSQEPRENVEEVLALPVDPLMSTGLESRRCAHHWTRPLGGGRWEHYFRGLLGVHWLVQNNASHFSWDFGNTSIKEMPYMPSLSGTAQSPWL